MKKYPGIDYSQRPESYWQDEDLLAALLRNVKGRERRKLIRAYWEQGRLEELRGVLLEQSLTEDERDRLGKIHPAFMGGEYLPDYLDAEVEIARIELNSTTSDVTSIRAHKAPGGVGYRIVDEYDTEFDLARQTSKGPLTLCELVEFIDNSSHPEFPCGLALCYNEMNVAERADRKFRRYFTRVTSDIYPQLEDHFEAVFDEWVNEGAAEQ